MMETLYSCTLTEYKLHYALHTSQIINRKLVVGLKLLGRKTRPFYVSNKFLEAFKNAWDAHATFEHNKQLDSLYHDLKYRSSCDLHNNLQHCQSKHSNWI